MMLQLPVLEAAIALELWNAVVALRMVEASLRPSRSLAASAEEPTCCRIALELAVAAILSLIRTRSQFHSVASRVRNK